ncbi:ROK family transcriptional regulator [Kineothrix sedimenti]|uniref:ROK family transcriptional regulator n=1 Tax=Kineothrix sedimenti TaxID=3123317 RepID=A0ABZ3EYS1_9FIRM
MKRLNQSDKPECSIVRVAKYILEQEETSKNEIASALNLSMPTTLQCVKDLTNQGIIQEAGEYESTGGRKAKTLSVVETLHYSVGIEITANHISFVIIDMKAHIIDTLRIRLVFHHAERYYATLAKKLTQFIWDSGVPQSKILGVGISIPGIVISSENRLVISHVLYLKDIDLNSLAKHIPYPVCFENDAVCAAMAELKYFHNNMLYLSLSNSVGGAIFLNNELYYGNHFRSGEFGHMLIEPDGKQCYCGKCGCADAYCSAKILANYTKGNLNTFFKRLQEGDAEIQIAWSHYLKYLAIIASNLHLTFDCDIILGGYVGSYIEPYLPELWDNMQEYLLFEQDNSFLHPCRFQQNAAGVGIAMHFTNQFFSKLN